MDATAATGQISIARRFAGPRDSANGGYAAGVLAGAFLAGRTTRADRADGANGDNHEATGAVEVTLRKPPPLDTAMLLRGDTDDASHSLTLSLDDQVVAHARPGALAADPVDAVSLAAAREAERSYAGLTAHPFVACFACGPEREPGDGLRLSPGRIGDGRTACTWTPDGSLAAHDEPTRLRPEFVWAALDCPGGWTTDVVGRPMVLGRITGEIYAPAEVGERHVVMGRLLGEDGRKTFTATTLYDSDGRVVARAEHVWVAVDPAMFT
jgi:hypothetical protein